MTPPVPLGEGDDEVTADQCPCQGTTSIRSRWMLSSGYYEHIRQIIHDLNGHGGGSRMAFQFRYHSARNCVMVNFRPGLKACTGLVMMTRALSLLLGWPDRETLLLLGRGNTWHMAPFQPRQDLVKSLFVHWDLAADAHMVGNVRNWLLHTVPMEGHYGQVVCYLPTVAEHELPGHMVQYENATRAFLEVLRTLRFQLPGHAQLGCALGSHYQRIPGIQPRLQWGPDQTPSGSSSDIHTIMLDGLCQLLEWTDPAPAACSMPRQEGLTAQHHGDPGCIRGHSAVNC